jgi:predicted ATPase/DNA-binding SARP family transcriptional activator/DNA-binding CsgD family transcriptional regulator
MLACYTCGQWILRFLEEEGDGGGAPQTRGNYDTTRRLPVARVADDQNGAMGRKPETVRVKLLGGFRISVGSRTIGEDGWRLRKARSLIKLLALAPGHRMHREQIMEWLWPDLDPKAAANNLHYALHVARRVLEPASATSSCQLQFHGNRLALCPDGSLWIDVEAFEAAAATARRTREPTAYQTALNLYAGDLLPGDRYENWAEDRRRELREAVLSLLVELATLHEEREEFELAIEALRRAIAVEPVREEAHAGLMRLHALSGRHAEALRQYEQLRELLSQELCTEPSTASRRLREEILEGWFPPSPSPARSTTENGRSAEGPPGITRHNLPADRSSFVGREREVLEAKRELAMTRLLTLIGTGGCGKTRLAVAVAKDLVSAYPDGAWLVKLAPLSEPELVPQAVAEALSVREQPGRPLDATLADHLRTKEMLLILDNCEHLVEAAADLEDGLLDACPRLRVLATSREAMRIPGEVVWRVPSLSAPDPEDPASAEELGCYEAVRLFLERARSRRPGFELTEENAGTVAEICRRLDGIPLAIELAAARVGVLSVEQIAARLDDSLGLLRSGGRTSELRHQTLRGTLDWSYALLNPAEKNLFCKLSVFAGGWTLEAVDAVEAGNGIGDGEVLDLLSGLVDKSLVVTETPQGAGDALRYSMLSPVRQYGREQLEESGDAETARGRHALWCLAFAEEAEPQLVGAEQAGWLERLETEHDNLRAALGWFLERGEAEQGLRLTGALGEFWRVRGHLREGLRWLEEALASGGDTSPARAKALVHAGWIAWERVDFERSRAFSEEALAASRGLGYKEGAAAALYNLGMIAIYDQIRPREAWTLFEESLALRRELGDTVGAGRTLQRIGLIAVVGQDFERAAALYEESLGLARESGDRLGLVLALWLGALTALGRGDHRRVKALCEEGLDLARQLRNTHALVLITHVLAASAGSHGRPVRSARLWGAAESLLDTLGLTLGPAEHHHYGPYLAAARAQLGPKAWEAAWAQGRAMPLEEVVEYALTEEEQAPTTIPASEEPSTGREPVALTRREREIAVQVARGLTNRQIATELVISEHTVATHIGKILKKLRLHSRAQIAVWVAK